MLRRSHSYLAYVWGTREIGHVWTRKFIEALGQGEVLFPCFPGSSGVELDLRNGLKALKIGLFIDPGLSKQQIQTI